MHKAERARMYHFQQQRALISGQTRKSLSPVNPATCLWPGCPCFFRLLPFSGTMKYFHLSRGPLTTGPRKLDGSDGGKKQVELLQPVINGVILPAVSIALGTLSATTINSLRDRQRQLRACLHKEACLLDLLLSGTLTIFDGRRRTDERRSALTLLKFYCLRLITESTARFDFDAVSRTEPPTPSSALLCACSTALRPFETLSIPPASRWPSTKVRWRGLSAPAAPTLEVMRRRTSRSPASKLASRPPSSLASRTRQFNMQINSKELMMIRSEQLSLLQTSFPLEHWACMCLLGVSVVLCFLIETDEKTLQFLDLLQLRVIFTILIGALSGIASICVDLNDPFRGSFRITQSSAQLCECLPPIPFPAPRSLYPVPLPFPRPPLHAPRDRTVTAAEMLFFHSASHATASCLR